MKIIALDIGDVWTGIALSDQLQIIAKPYQTIETPLLVDFLKQLFTKETIKTVIIGYPKTMKGTISQQTQKVEKMKDDLQLQFPEKQFISWDERLSSKRAQELKKAISKEDKIKSHSIAAAYILQTYLEFLHQSKNLYDDNEF